MNVETLEQEAAHRHDGGAKRRQIMDGARAVFLAAGFDGASMNDVARSAGVSKGTLYAYFDSKDDLFDAIIRAEFAQAAERLCTFRREGDVRDMLTDFGVRLISRMAKPNVLALARVVIAATEKFPKIGVAFYKGFGAPCSAPIVLRVSLRRWKRPAPSRSPTPSAPPGNLSTCARATSTSASCSAWPSGLEPDEIEAAVTAGVDVFLKAYGT